VPNNITLYEIWFGHKPILSQLPFFGCKAYALIHKNVCQKLDSHTIECIFLEYSEKSKAYQLMKLDNYGIVIFHKVPIKVKDSIIKEYDRNPFLDVNFFK
jgi:hypothetical protein